MPRRNQVNVRFSDEELMLLDELVERGRQHGYPDRSKVIRELAGFSPLITVTAEDRTGIMARVAELRQAARSSRASPKQEMRRRATA